MPPPPETIMFNKEELAAFLALLLAFTEANHLSAASAARVLGVSHSSAARWMAMARKQDNKLSVYSWMANPVIEKINKLNAVDAARGTYKAIAGQSPIERVDLLLRILDDKIIW